MCLYGSNIMISKVVYKGDLRTESTHLQSGETIFADAHTCPVSGSLNNDLNEIVEFIYPKS